TFPSTAEVLAPSVSGTPLEHSSLDTDSLPTRTGLLVRGSLDSAGSAKRVVVENAEAANSHANILWPRFADFRQALPEDDNEREKFMGRTRRTENASRIDA
ncbi:MAG: hypothetical protein RR778_16300, partial [Glutamicibacter sp.]|uniref:hypothetical protein n=1 Tax=Glutamicibacter sp. TaxID=1931995 RepID=UPI002FC63D6C